MAISSLAKKNSDKAAIFKEISQAPKIEATDVFNFLAHYGSEESNTDILERLLDDTRYAKGEGPDLNMPDPVHNNTAIHLALATAPFRMLERLFHACIKHQFRKVWTTANSNREVPLHLIISRRDPIERVKLTELAIHELSPSLLAANSDDKTPLEHACTTKPTHLEFLSAKNQSNETLLHMNANEEHLETLAAILACLDPNNPEHVAIVNQQDIKGDTVLHKLIALNSLKANEVIKGNSKLFKSCCTVPNFRKYTPMHLAIDAGNIDCLDFFTQYSNEGENELRVDFAHRSFSTGPHNDNLVFTILRKVQEHAQPKWDMIYNMIEFLGRVSKALFHYEHPDHRGYSSNGTPSEYLSELPNATHELGVRLKKAASGEYHSAYKAEFLKRKQRRLSTSIDIRVSSDEVRQALTSSRQATPRFLEVEKFNAELAKLQKSLAEVLSLVSQLHSVQATQIDRLFKETHAQVTAGQEAITGQAKNNHAALVGEHGLLPHLAEKLDFLKAQLQSSSGKDHNATLMDSLVSLTELISSITKTQETARTTESSYAQALSELRKEVTTWRETLGVQLKENQGLTEKLARTQLLLEQSQQREEELLARVQLLEKTKSPSMATLTASSSPLMANSDADQKGKVSDSELSRGGAPKLGGSNSDGK